MGGRARSRSGSMLGRVYDKQKEWQRRASSRAAAKNRTVTDSSPAASAGSTAVAMAVAAAGGAAAAGAAAAGRKKSNVCARSASGRTAQCGDCCALSQSKSSTELHLVVKSGGTSSWAPARRAAGGPAGLRAAETTTRAGAPKRAAALASPRVPRKALPMPAVPRTGASRGRRPGSRHQTLLTSTLTRCARDRGSRRRGRRRAARVGWGMARTAGRRTAR